MQPETDYEQIISRQQRPSISGITALETKDTDNELSKLTSKLRWLIVLILWLNTGCITASKNKTQERAPQTSSQRERKTISLEAAIQEFRFLTKDNPLLISQPELLANPEENIAISIKDKEKAILRPIAETSLSPSRTIIANESYFEQEPIHLDSVLLGHPLKKQREYLKRQGAINFLFKLIRDIDKTPALESQDMIFICKEIKNKVIAAGKITTAKKRELLKKILLEKSVNVPDVIPYRNFWGLSLSLSKKELHKDIEKTIDNLNDASIAEIFAIQILETLLMQTGAKGVEDTKSPVDFFKSKKFDCNTIAVLRYAIAHDAGLKDLSLHDGTPRIKGVQSRHAWLKKPLRFKNKQELHWVLNTTILAPGRAFNQLISSQNQVSYTEDHEISDPLEIIYASLAELCGGSYEYSKNDKTNNIELTTNLSPQQMVLAIALLKMNLLDPGSARRIYPGILINAPIIMRDLKAALELLRISTPQVINSYERYCKGTALDRTGLSR